MPAAAFDAQPTRVGMGHNRPMAFGVLAHGAGSTGDVVRRLIAPADLGCESLVYLEDRTGDIDTVIALLEGAAGDRCDRGEPVVVGGVSLGAHAAIRWTARRRQQHRRGPSLVLAALPAWTGEPDEVARANAITAGALRALGAGSSRPADLAAGPLLHADLAADPHGSVITRTVLPLVALGWHGYAVDELAEALDRAGCGPGPTAEELAAVDVPVIIASWSGDALHPEAVADAWASHLPRARHVRIDWDALDLDTRAFGHAIRVSLTDWRLIAGDTP